MTMSSLMTIRNDIYKQAERLYIGIDDDNKGSRLKRAILKCGGKFLLILLKGLSFSSPNILSFVSLSWFVFFLSYFNYVEFYKYAVIGFVILFLSIIFSMLNEPFVSKNRMKRLIGLGSVIENYRTELEPEKSMNVLRQDLEQFQKRVVRRLYTRIVGIGLVFALACYILISEVGFFQVGIFENLGKGFVMVILFLPLAFLFSEYKQNIDEIFTDIKLSLNEKAFEWLS
jgi:hypothetical protein